MCNKRGGEKKRRQERGEVERRKLTGLKEKRSRYILLEESAPRRLDPRGRQASADARKRVVAGAHANELAQGQYSRFMPRKYLDLLQLQHCNYADVVFASSGGVVIRRGRGTVDGVVYTSGGLIADVEIEELRERCRRVIVGRDREEEGR